MGEAPRYLGSIEACRLSVPRRGTEMSSSRRMCPNATTSETSGRSAASSAAGRPSLHAVGPDSLAAAGGPVRAGHHGDNARDTSPLACQPVEQRERNGIRSHEYQAERFGHGWCPSLGSAGGVGARFAHKLEFDRAAVEVEL